VRAAVLAAEADELPEGLEATVVATAGRAWPGAVHVDELTDSFDVAVACGWRAALHLFRVDARGYAYLVREREDAAMWHGDEKRILAAATYDLPCDLIATSAELEADLTDTRPGARIHRARDAAELTAVLERVARSEPVRDWPRRLLLSALGAAQPVAQERHALQEALGAREREVEALKAENERLRAELAARSRRRFRLRRSRRP
jgi:hypothetical protein